MCSAGKAYFTFTDVSSDSAIDYSIPAIGVVLDFKGSGCSSSDTQHSALHRSLCSPVTRAIPSSPLVTIINCRIVVGSSAMLASGEAMSTPMIDEEFGGVSQESREAQTRPRPFPFRMALVGDV
jgi:hypothetical protein